MKRTCMHMGEMGEPFLNVWWDFSNPYELEVGTLFEMKTNYIF